jgi:hypothetical protein
MILYLPNPTEKQKTEAFEEVKKLAEKDRNWRKGYFEAYPKMDSRTGVNKLNNFLYRSLFDADIYRSLIIFFNSTNI